MSPALNPIRFPLGCLESLRGGRAPDSWSRELAGKTQWLSAAVNSCNWLEEMVNIDLRVSRYPLFGHSLAALANLEAINPAAPPSAAARTAKQPANEVQGGLAKTSTSIAARDLVDGSGQDVQSTRSTSTSKDSSLSCPPEPVLELKPQADISLLRRHAGEHIDSTGDGDSRTIRPGIGPGSDRIRRPDDLHRESTPTLLARAARRAEAAYIVSARERRGFDRFTIDNQALSSNSPTLAEHWSRTVAGVCAPAELLTQLASSESGVDRTFQGVEKREPSGWSAASPTTTALGNSRRLREPQLSGSSLADNRYEDTQWPAALSRSLPAFTGVEPPSEDPVVNTSSLPSQSGPRTIERSEGPTDARIAPPTITPSLFALRPPSALNGANLPVAAVINQGGAKSEERLAQGDDLALLAAKLERLLTQEARRHGIDV
jgi:hypothetical protein